MTLPFDYWRCPGTLVFATPDQQEPRGVQAQCETCQRYTAPHGPRQSVMIPHFLGEICPERISE